MTDDATIQKIIQNPYNIVGKTLEPDIWTNNSVKKAVIKYLLDQLQNGEKSLVAINYVYKTLKQNNCPWPELAVIETHVNTMNKESDDKVILKFLNSLTWFNKTFRKNLWVTHNNGEIELLVDGYNGKGSLRDPNRWDAAIYINVKDMSAIRFVTLFLQWESRFDEIHAEGNNIVRLWWD